MSSDRLDTGTSASQRPNYLSDPNLPNDQRTRLRWFNTDALAVPDADPSILKRPEAAARELADAIAARMPAVVEAPA